jgi:hypothetical protein
MKTTVTIITFLLALLITSCVQKSYKKTVVFTLDASKVKNINKVGIRGNDKPLSWDYDTEMMELKKDSFYEIKVTFETGYTFTEVKFIVNDSLEFKDQDNRRVDFSKTDTTFYNAKFNKR